MSGGSWRWLRGTRGDGRGVHIEERGRIDGTGGGKMVQGGRCREGAGSLFIFRRSVVLVSFWQFSVVVFFGIYVEFSCWQHR